MLRVGEAFQGPSRTAVLTAAARALHREEPPPWVMDDYLALNLAGQEGLALLDRLRAEVPRPYLLAFSRWVCIRARFPEDLVDRRRRRPVRDPGRRPRLLRLPPR
jgi:O-methyltransferase involved in polyketide biosynthesis